MRRFGGTNSRARSDLDLASDAAVAGLRAAWDRTCLVLGDPIARFVFRRAASAAALTEPSLAGRTFAWGESAGPFADGSLDAPGARAIGREVLVALESLAGPRLAAVVRADVEAVERVHRVLALRAPGASAG